MTATVRAVLPLTRRAKEGCTESLGMTSARRRVEQVECGQSYGARAGCCIWPTAGYFQAAYSTPHCKSSCLEMMQRFEVEGKI